MEKIITNEQRLENIERLLLANKSVLTFDEARNYTGISASYLYKLTSSKKIPHSKPLGKLIFFDRANLDRWMLGRQVKTIDEINQDAINYVAAKRKFL